MFALWATGDFMSTEKTLLEKELGTYRKRVSEWDDKIGQYALIQNETVVGFYTSYADAMAQGYAKFGLETFLVKQINVVEQTHFLPPLMSPANGAFHKAH